MVRRSHPRTATRDRRALDAAGRRLVGERPLCTFSYVDTMTRAGASAGLIHSVRFADAELDRRIPRERSAGPFPEALDEPKPTQGEQQWQLLREDAPELELCDDEVGLEVGG